MPRTPAPPRRRYCGRAIEQAHTGRPRQWCNDLCRRHHARAMAALESKEQPPLVLPDRSDVEQRLVALHCELRAAVWACFEIANELDRRSEFPHGWRFAAVGADLERSLARNFADLEGKP